MGFHPWKIRVAFPGESQLRQSSTTQPTVHAGCFSVSISHRTLTWTRESITCAPMLLRATAHGGVWTLWESLHWKLTLGEKSLSAPGSRTCVSSVPVRWSNQLSYTPAPKTNNNKNNNNNNNNNDNKSVGFTQNNKQKQMIHTHTYMSHTTHRHTQTDTHTHPHT